jgi:hypothetical protein
MNSFRRTRRDSGRLRKAALTTSAERPEPSYRDRGRYLDFIRLRDVEDGAHHEPQPTGVVTLTMDRYPGLASNFGFVPCECGRTDGTVDCPHKRASDMIAAAFDFLAERDGEVIESADY